jgi:hypothetical protein
MKLNNRKIIFLILSLLSCTPILLFGQPKFNLIGGTRFDYGEINVSTTVQRILTIKNDGTDTLIISDVSASCGCTGTLLSNDHIAPGDSGALSISFDSKKFSGKVEKAVSMNTNDPSNKKVRIIFSANVISLLAIEPDYLFIKAPIETTTTSTVYVKNTSTEPIRLLSAKSDLDNFSITIAKNKIAPDTYTEITVKYKSSKTGVVKGNIEIKTDNAKISTLNIRVVTLVTGKSTP